MWFFLALGSAVVYAGKGILEKRIISSVNNYVLAFAVRIFALPFFFIPFFLNSKLLHVNFFDFHFWMAIVFISLISTPFETYFYYKALESEEATFILPILTLGPALTVFWGSFLLKEIPTWQGIVGTIVILFGIYALRISYAREGLLEPFHHLRKNPAVQMMLLVMLSQSIGGIFDKIGVVATNAYVYGVMNYIFVSLALFVIALVKAKSHLRQLITHGKSFSIIGAVIATYTLLNFAALQTGFAGYVSIVRTSYVLFTLVFGFFLLKERGIKQKLFSAGLILLGLIIIKLYS